MKPTTLRARLFLNLLLILLVGMSVAALLAWRSVESLYLSTQRENLLAQAALTAAALRGQNLSGEILPGLAPAAPYSQALNAAPGIHARLLDGAGGLAYSLPMLGEAVLAPPAEASAALAPGALLARPEVASALEGRPAAEVRRVAGWRVLYAAAPVLAEDGAVSGLVYLAMPLPAAGLPPEVLWQLGGAGLAAILVALLAGTLLARRVTAPVEAIARASARVSAGDLRQQVSAGGEIAELNSLGESFNRMTANLRQSEQARNAFVADVTHELRTPLTVIKGTIETLEDGALDDVEGRGPLLRSMQRETDRLIRLVNDLLVLTRADAGALNLDVQPLDLAALARERCAHFAPLAAKRGVRLETAGDPTAPALGDADRLAQVLDNLLDNALRYAPPGSVVTVEARLEGEHCRCAVTDAGPGIASEHLPFIFDRFYRADASRNRQTGGTGLGLAIVKALLEAQGGRAGVESTGGESPAAGEGRPTGTTVHFSLPVPPAAPSLPLAAPGLPPN